MTTTSVAGRKPHSSGSASRSNRANISGTAKPAASRGPFGELLHVWRQSRNVTQLTLSLESGVSQRHVSFLESGRSKPSREMVMLLADALDLSLRERNHWLDAAGFAGLYTERPLSGPNMQPVRDALQLQLMHHDPYPAFVIDRDWNLLMANPALLRLFAALGDPLAIWAATNPDGGQNIMRLTMHPSGLRAYCRNWEEIAPLLLQRLRRDANLTDSPAMLQLVEELKADESLEEYWQKPIIETDAQPVYSMVLSNGEWEVGLFSMISTFGTPQDITTDELRIELFFPMDTASQEVLNELSMQPMPAIGT